MFLGYLRCSVSGAYSMLNSGIKRIFVSYSKSVVHYFHVCRYYWDLVLVLSQLVFEVFLESFLKFCLAPFILGISQWMWLTSTSFCQSLFLKGSFVLVMSILGIVVQQLAVFGDGLFLEIQHHRINNVIFSFWTFSACQFKFGPLGLRTDAYGCR